MNTVVIGIGSNIDPEKNIRRARQFLKEKFQVLRESRFVETEPIGTHNQPKFMNGAVLIHTDLSPEKLKTNLCEIEDALGRKRSDGPYAPRTIDLDIVVWNDSIVDHDVNERSFLKTSVLEILPNIKKAIVD